LNRLLLLLSFSLLEKQIFLLFLEFDLLFLLSYLLTLYLSIRLFYRHLHKYVVLLNYWLLYHHDSLSNLQFNRLLLLILSSIYYKHIFLLIRLNMFSHILFLQYIKFLLIKIFIILLIRILLLLIVIQKR
jgi:hypothetical protein